MTNVVRLPGGEPILDQEEYGRAEGPQLLTDDCSEYHAEGRRHALQFLSSRLNEVTDCIHPGGAIGLAYILDLIAGQKV